MARKRKKKKQKRVASIDEIGILKRDLKQTALWIGIAVVAVLLFTTIEHYVI